MRQADMLKIVVVAAVCTCLTLVVLLMPIMFKGFRIMREDFRYDEAASYFTHEVDEYLSRYYRNYGHYPVGLNVSDFAISKEEGYRTVANRIEYSTDGNSFEVTWRYPITIRQPDRLRVWICKGVNGKRTYFESKIVKSGNNN